MQLKNVQCLQLDQLSACWSHAVHQIGEPQWYVVLLDTRWFPVGLGLPGFQWWSQASLRNLVFFLKWKHTAGVTSCWSVGPTGKQHKHILFIPALWLFITHLQSSIEGSRQARRGMYGDSYSQRHCLAHICLFQLHSVFCVSKKQLFKNLLFTLYFSFNSLLGYFSSFDGDQRSYPPPKLSF